MVFKSIKISNERKESFLDKFHRQLNIDNTARNNENKKYKKISIWIEIQMMGRNVEPDF